MNASNRLSKSLTVLFYSVAVVGAGGIESAPSGFEIVTEGRPNAVIVLNENRSEQAAEAAVVLQRYLHRISGASLEIHSSAGPSQGPRILVGRGRAVAELGVQVPSGHTRMMNEEGFASKTLGTDLILAGNEDWNYRGTLYAVYDFLEELGGRWFFPGEFGEVIPDLETVRVEDRDRVERPSFRFRNLWYSGWFPTSATDSARLRDWYDKNKLASLDMSLPSDGSVIRLAPPDTYFESNPEIYALDEKGERRRDMLCMTHPDSIRIAIETIEKTFAEDPKALTFGFAPPDGFPVCHCKTCQEYFPGFEGKGYGDPSLSDLWFQYANRIATEVYKKYPDRWLLTNGYANRVRPPEGIGKLSPNLGIQSAIIAACSIHRVGDPKCWQRLLYRQVLDRWTDLLDCVFIYDYDPASSLVNLPFPALHNLKHDIPYFKQRGVWGFWTEGTNTWMSTHLNYYVRSKLMWNADEDVDTLVHDYCERFYQDAGEPVEKYLWTLEAVVESATVHETWGRLMPWRVLLPPIMDQLDRLIQEAESLARSPEVKKRVHVLRLAHEHMRAYLEMEKAVAEGEFAKGVEWGEKMLPIRDETESIQPGLLPHSPDWVKSFRTSLEWHLKMYRGLADRTGGASGELEAMLPREWSFKKDEEDIGVLYEWYNQNLDASWEPIDTTLYWEAQGHQDEKGWGYWGKAWYALDFDLPQGADSENLWLTIGAVYNEGVWVWVNGQRLDFKKDRHWRLGYHDVRTPIDIDLSEVLRPGETNRIAVLVNTPTPGRNPRGGLHRRAFLWKRHDG